MRPASRRLVFAASSLLAATTLGCASALGPIEPATFSSTCCPDGRASIDVQYLGVGGWLIRGDGGAILTAPLFSNPSFMRVGLWSIHPDTALINRFMPDASDVSAILVGHAHYDHLMDVPYVARRHAPTATVYGNETTRNILAAGGVPWHRRVSLNDRAGDSENGGEWVTVAGGRIRFMALRSDHAPHFRGIELYEGFYRSRQPDLPVFAWDWVGGETLAYLIDFLDENGQVEFRIHYADATSSPPDGHVAPAVLAEHPVDLAVLCPPSFSYATDYPEGILANLRPRFVMLGHWEDFFRPRTEPTKVVRLFDVQEFVRRMKTALPADTEWWMPEPGVAVQLPIG